MEVHPDKTAVIDGARRAMRATFQREAEKAVAHLASIGVNYDESKAAIDAILKVADNLR